MKPIPILAVLVLALAACSEDNTVINGAHDPYSEALTHPDSLLTDLETAFLLRDITGYENLLAVDFRFVFDPDLIAAAPSLETFWTRGEDVAFTGDLFACPQVLGIRMALLWGDPETGTTSTGLTAERVRVSDMFLDVDLEDGVTLRIDGAVQELFFVEGRPDKGEDSARRYLVEWREVGEVFGAALPTAVEQTTVWKLKSFCTEITGP